MTRNFTRFGFFALLLLTNTVFAQITKVNLTFTPVDGGSVVTASAASGTYGLAVEGPINLLESTEYRLTIDFADQDANFKARQDELRFFFELSTEELLINEVRYDDQDANMRPVGFTNLLTTECKEAEESGLFRMILVDYGANKSDTSNADNGTQLFDLSWAINVQNDDQAPACENDEEIITDVTLTFMPRNGGEPVIARAQDPDGEGILGLEILDDINLGLGQEYDLSLTVTNAVAGEDITEEIEEEDDEHMFFFAWTNGLFSSPSGDGNIDNRMDPMNYLDFDENNNPVGLQTNWTVSNSMQSGTFRLVLKHQPDSKSASSSSTDGATDLDLSWDVNTVVISSTQRQQQLNRELRVAPNPVKNVLYWDIAGQPAMDSEVLVRDLFGRVLAYQKLSQQWIDLSSLAPGTYLLQVQNAGETRVQKFVKF